MATQIDKSHEMTEVSKDSIHRSKKWLVRGLVKFATAVARLVCPDLLGHIVPEDDSNQKAVTVKTDYNFKCFGFFWL